MKKPKYYLSRNSEFVIENFNAAPTFSSFFPGIAGIYGCPMWVFYTNRSQAITSAGVRDKDGAIMEFQSANKAFRLVAQTGFRTFLKVDGVYYEPFCESYPGKNEMRITPYDLTIIEENPKLKLRTEVKYFTVPNESFPALARVVTVSNLSRKKRSVEIIDGLPSVVPYGFADDLLKRISRTIEAWCVVENLDNHAPYYKLKVSPADVSETHFFDRGNFFYTLAKNGKKEEPVKIIVDPKVVFGQNKSLLSPDNFLTSRKFAPSSKKQCHGFTPCALAFKRLVLERNSSFSLSTVTGQADSLKHLDAIKKKVSSRDFFSRKAEENKNLIEDICREAETKSAFPAFDQYCKQTYLDNVMRGGLPVKIGKKVLYVYYRKHGDMERDYNNFKLMPTYFSQGTGNYRDIDQNRRCDVFFNPETGADNIARFFNLVQLDGFNPLIVSGSQLCLKDKNVFKRHLMRPDEYLQRSVEKPFFLGDILKYIEEKGIPYKTGREALAEDLVNGSDIQNGGSHGEGFWIDHPFYNTDLLESFECVYPERMRELLFEKRSFTFFQNDHYVAARAQKYMLENGKVRQHRSVLKGESSGDIVRTLFGKGEPYYTTLISKILCLAANKAASFDAQGIGLEMEADKPDWYDALNGLPALFGSSLSETLELKRLALFALKYLDENVRVNLPVEVKGLIDEINGFLAARLEPFEYWDKTYAAKEKYRAAVKDGISGQEAEIDGGHMRHFLENIVAKCDAAVQSCLNKYHNYYTYFINEAADFTERGGVVEIKKFTQKPLPLFLEGFVHALRVEKDKKIYARVKNSPLFDKKLKMYKVNASLGPAPIEIGRARVFTPGWLENESVWLHMEYKYMLELLKAGMHKEFFSDFKDAFIPFLDPKVYGRSILENSSFLTSSAHPNQDLHGRGFVARLSGGAAEFLDIWIIMTTGKNIFYLDADQKLNFRLFPVLPKWFFKKGEFSFKLLGSIDVTYTNAQNKNTYDGLKPVAYRLFFDGQDIEIKQPFIPEPYSQMIRERKIKKIIVTLS